MKSFTEMLSLWMVFLILILYLAKCTHSEPNGYHIGCFVDHSDRDMKERVIDSGSLTQEQCFTKCREKNYAYAGIQVGHECWCGNKYAKYGSAPDQADCDIPCAGNAAQTQCGGHWRNSIYSILPTPAIEMMGLSLTERGRIEESLSSGELLADVLSTAGKAGVKAGKDPAKLFAKQLGQIAKKASKFLKGIGSIISLVLAFLPSEAEILHKELLQRFDKIDLKLQSISNKLEHLPSTIHWVNSKQSYNDHVFTIRIFEEKLVELINSTSKEAKRQDILRHYDNSWDLAGKKLFEILLGTDIVSHYFNYTKWDRPATLAFIASSLDYLILAGQVQISMIELRDISKDWNPPITEEARAKLISDEAENWANRVGQVEQKMTKWDEWAASDYWVVDKSRSDIAEYIKDSGMLNLGKQGFVDKVRDELDRKYFWRKWAVISARYSEKDDGYFQHYYFTENKYVWQSKFQQGGEDRQLIVVNYDIDSTLQSQCQTSLGQFKSDQNAISWERGFWNWDCKLNDERWVYCRKMMKDAQNRLQIKINSVASDGFAMTIYDHQDMYKATTSGYDVAQVSDLKTCTRCDWACHDPHDRYGYYLIDPNYAENCPRTEGFEHVFNALSFC